MIFIAKYFSRINHVKSYLVAQYPPPA